MSPGNLTTTPFILGKSMSSAAGKAPIPQLEMSILSMAVALLVATVVAALWIDLPLRDAIHSHPSEVLRWITWFSGRVGRGELWIVVIVLLTARSMGPKGQGGVWSATECRQKALQLALAIVLSTVVVTLAKYAVGRPRPSEFFRSGAVLFCHFCSSTRYASFPSGHAQTVWAGLGTIAYWFPNWRGRLAILGVFGCIGRVIMLRHYVSDICCGAAIGLVFALLAHRIVAARQKGGTYSDGSVTGIVATAHAE
jgi:membrane-associated phospholipid phosphatase